MSQTEETKTQPTKEEFIAHLKEQIELAEVRATLQSLNTRIAKDRAEELQALVFIAQVTNPGKFSEEDPEEEPSASASEPTPSDEQPSSRKLKKS